jgi:hypothetical protein
LSNSKTIGSHPSSSQNFCKLLTVVSLGQCASASFDSRSTILVAGYDKAKRSSLTGSDKVGLLEDTGDRVEWRSALDV